MTSDPAFQPAFSARTGIFTWATIWLTANLFVVPLVVLLAGYRPGDSLGAPIVCATLLAQWSVIVVGVVIASRVWGTGNVLADLGMTARPVDLLGVPAGIVTQLWVVPAIYVPLQRVWPDAFSTDEIDKRSQTLIDSAHGGWIVILAIFVIVGAPLMEELLYRGLVQRSLTPPMPRTLALFTAAGLFAVVHFSPVEIPGLMVAGLLFGFGIWRWGRTGFGVAAHMGFNAAAIAVGLMR